MTDFPIDPGVAAGAAWARVHRPHAPATWDDWLVIGAGLMAGRNAAMLAAGTNQPFGKKYVTHFGAYLKRHGLNSTDKSTRAKLLRIMERLPQIRAWRDAQPDRANLNHPSTILRRFLKTPDG
jgi:hypothetical protein